MRNILLIMLSVLLIFAFCGCAESIKDIKNELSSTQYYCLVTGVTDMTFELKDKINSNAVQSKELSSSFKNNSLMSEKYNDKLFEQYDTANYILYNKDRLCILITPVSYNSSIYCVETKDELDNVLNNIFAQNANLGDFQAHFNTGEYFSKESSVLGGTKFIVNGEMNFSEESVMEGYLCLFEKPRGGLYLMIAAEDGYNVSKAELLHMVQSLKFIEDKEKNVGSGPFNSEDANIYK